MAKDIAAATKADIQAPALVAGNAIIRAVQNFTYEGPNLELILIEPIPERTKAALVAHRAELQKSLGSHNRAMIGVMIGTMLDLYNIKERDVEAERLIAKYVTALGHIPTWAVSQACRLIMDGRAEGVSHYIPPTPIQVRVLANSFAEPARAQLYQIERMIKAKPPVSAMSADDKRRMAKRLSDLAENLRAKTRTLDDNERRSEAIRRRSAQERHMRRAWEREGQEPVVAGDFILSPGLVRSIRNKQVA